MKKRPLGVIIFSILYYLIAAYFIILIPKYSQTRGTALEIFGYSMIVILGFLVISYIIFSTFLLRGKYPKILIPFMIIVTPAFILLELSYIASPDINIGGVFNLLAIIIINIWSSIYLSYNPRAKKFFSYKINSRK